MKKIMSWLMLVVTVSVALLGGFAQPSHAATATTDDSLARVKEKGTLVMGTSPDYPPYEFLVNRGGKDRVVGMDVDIAKKIAKDLGVKLVIKQMDFDSLLVALETNKVDMVISGMSPTPARQKSVDFSKVYYKGGQSIIINKADKGLYKNKDSFRNKAVGAQTGSIQYNLGKKQIKGSTVKGLAKISDLILALKSHKVEGVIMEEPSAQAYVDNDPDLAMIDGKFSLGSGENNTAIGFKKGSTSLVNAVNKSVDEINQKNLTKTYLKHAGTFMKTNAKNTSMWHYAGYFVKGVEYTLLITVVSVFFGILLGILFALMRLSKMKLIHGLGVAYIEFVRGTPLMIQVMFVYFGIGLFINIPALIAGIIAVSLNSAAYVAEIIRGGINSVAKGQTEAARSLGLSRQQTFQSVVFPQALKNIWPALGNEFVSLIKESSIVSIIGVTDLIYQLKAVQTATYKGVIPIVVAMIIYFVLTFSLSKVLNHYERKMKHDA
ncbi:ABC transporter substrate-binding protein/permease [Loigolactobacillus coryniformis]|uniref:ABC transporter substrate-binding protein/permease n=1 Tax=Loigolactobacillus coryniformis TaxID=1610 RepID=UPI003F23C70B